MHRLVSLAVAVVTSGCVTMGTYEQKAGEAARLRADLDAEQARGAERARELERKVAEQEAAKAKLAERIAGLENDLTSKEADRAELEKKANELLALNEELSKSSKKLAEAKAELEKKSTDYEGLAKSLQAEISAGKIELSELRGKMTVKMKDKILFASGSATVGQEGLDALAKVAQAFKGVRGRIVRVEGHTDNEPVGKNVPFANNWELSVARSLAVVKVLQDQGVNPTVLSAAGFGEYHPIARNDSPEHKSLNRRIEIVLAPPESAVATASLPVPSEPEKAPAKVPAKAPKGSGAKKK